MGHNSLFDDLAFCGHNERINQLEEYKSHMTDMMTKDKRLKKANKHAIRYYDWLIKICNNYKDQPAITEEWLNKYLKRKYPNNVLGGVLGIKGKIRPTINDYYKLLKKEC